MLRFGTVTTLVMAVGVLAGADLKACSTHEHIITKAVIEATDLRLYERDVTLRDRDITRFDARNPLIGRLLGDQQFYQQELQLWQSHPFLFDRHNPRLWHVLDGDMLYHERHPFETPPPVPVGHGDGGAPNIIPDVPYHGDQGPPHDGSPGGGVPNGGGYSPGGEFPPGGGFPPDGGTSPGGGIPPGRGNQHGGGPPDGAPGVASVPEPSAGVLLFTGLIFGLLCATWRLAWVRREGLAGMAC